MTTLWQSNFERMPLGKVTDRLDDWSFWGHGGQENLYGYPYVVDAKAEGISCQANKVLKLNHRPGDPTLHHKLFKTWSKASWPQGADNSFPHDSPADVSGRYSALFWIAPDLNLTAVLGGHSGWANIFQFKEAYLDGNGQWQQDPSHWLGLSLEGGRPVLQAATWGMNTTRPMMAPILGRWFDVEARLYQGDRIEWWVDGKLFDTVHAIAYPVGRMYPDDESQGWTYGIGNYCGQPSQTSCVYVDNAALTSLT